MVVCEATRPLNVVWDRFRGSRLDGIFVVYPRGDADWFHIMPWNSFQSPEDMYDYLGQSIGESIGRLIAGGTLLHPEVDFTVVNVPEAEVIGLIRRWYLSSTQDPRPYPLDKFLDAQVRIHSRETNWGSIRQIVGEMGS